MSQTHYLEKILDKFSKYDERPARMPVDASLHLPKNKGDSVSQLEYSKIIESLMYSMNCTRPNIAYAMSKLSKFTHNPSKIHWQVLVLILRYLRYCKSYKLNYTRYPAVLEQYCDAN